jgi:esterase/lipase superfamily enzyme
MELNRVKRIVAFSIGVFLAGITSLRADEQACNKAKDVALQAVNTAFGSKKDLLLTIAKTLQDKGFDPRKYPVIMPDGTVDTVDLPEVIAKIAFENANAVQQIEEATRDCTNGSSGPEKISSLATFFSTDGLSSILPKQLARIDASAILSGSPFGGPNALIPKSRDDILQGLGIGGDVAEIIRDPRCIIRGSCPGRTPRYSPLDPTDVKALQPVYYATNRNVTDVAELQASSFTSTRSLQLKYGITIVSIPKNHVIGNVERPYSKESNADDFRIASISSLARGQLIDELRANFDSVLLFVHGYNVPFEDAIFKAAQIAYDPNFDGSVLVFSWPSAGEFYKYDYDRESAQFSGGDLLSILRILTEEIGEKRIYIVAHSLGNQILVDALQQAALSKVHLNISELVMAAPDVDKDVFMKKAAEIESVAKNITMYASSADKALLASDKKAWGARLGYIEAPGPNLTKGVDTIDVTAVGDDMLGLNHSTFSGSRAVLDDIGRLIRSRVHLPPIDRSPTLQSVPDKEHVRYWLYPR